MVYGMMFSIVGTMSFALSLAEMASICPIAGAQYQYDPILLICVFLSSLLISVVGQLFLLHHLSELL